MRRIWTMMICLCLLFTSGCGFEDIDQRFFIVAIGVDKGKVKKYEVTLKLVIPSPAIEPGKSKFQLISKEADSLSDALKFLSSEVDKELDMGHAKVIIFSKAIGEEDIKEPLLSFIRRRDIQRIEYLALGEPSAKKLLELSPKSERLAADSLFLMFGKGGTDSPFITTEYLYDFYRKMLEKGTDPFLPIITEGEGAFQINRAALLNKQKVVMTLSKDETGVFNQLLRKKSNYEIVASEAGLKFALSVEDLQYKYTISETTPPKINMKITIKAVAEESNQSLFDRDWKPIEKIAEKQMEKKYETLLEEIKNNHIDPLGFGLTYLATHHNGEKDWKKWTQLYPKMTFDVNVNVILKGTGIIK
jgi:spore germination protein KC